MTNSGHNKSNPHEAPKSSASVGHPAGFDAHIVNRIFDAISKMDSKLNETCVTLARHDSKLDGVDRRVSEGMARLGKSIDENTSEIRNLNNWKTRIMAIAGFVVVILGLAGALAKLL